MSEEDDKKPRGKLTMRGNYAGSIGPGAYGFLVTNASPDMEIDVSDNLATNVFGGAAFGIHYRMPQELSDAIAKLDAAKQAEIVGMLNAAKAESKGSTKFIEIYQNIIAFTADNIAVWGPVLPTLTTWLLSC